MHRHVLRSVIGLLVICQASFGGGAEQFTVTDRHTSEFVVEERAGPLEFVVTTRESPVAGPTTPARPFVLFYSAKWCVPCQTARQELQRSRLPFEIRLVDVTQGGQPEYVDGIPYFEWQSGRGRWFAKWTSVADLVKRWELTR